MQTRKYFLLCAGVVAIGVVFAATEVKAQPSQCAAGRYTIKFEGRSTFPDGTARWRYQVQDLPNLPTISHGVMVVPLPVTPNDIKSPIPQNFCEEADPNTKLNRGNCAGFPVRLPPERSGDTVLLDIITTDRITAGVVTLIVISEQGGSDVCVALVNDRPTGIVGPGATGGVDPIQPIFLEQLALVAGGKCIAKLIFDSRGQLRDVQTLTPECFVGEGALLISRNGKGLEELRFNGGPHGITFGSNTSTCYGPPAPSPPKCVCRQLPCP